MSLPHKQIYNQSIYFISVKMTEIRKCPLCEKSVLDNSDKLGQTKYDWHISCIKDLNNQDKFRQVMKKHQEESYLEYSKGYYDGIRQGYNKEIKE